MAWLVSHDELPLPKEGKSQSDDVESAATILRLPRQTSHSQRAYVMHLYHP